MPVLVREMQSGGAHGGGNKLLVYELHGRQLLLKVYRRRGSHVRQSIKNWSHLLFEGKLGVTPVERRRTEFRSLQIWQQQGFVVPEPLSLPSPPEYEAEPMLWMEFIAGPRLDEILEDHAISLDVKAEHIARVAATAGRRHRRALELDEPLLVQEHASVKHIIVADDRLVSFDLENGYRAGFPVVESLSQEVGGLLRSITRKAEQDYPGLLRVFVDNYPDSDQLRRIADYGVHARGFYRSMKRRADNSRRSQNSKTTMLESVLSLLDGA